MVAPTRLPPPSLTHPYPHPSSQILVLDVAGVILHAGTVRDVRPREVPPGRRHQLRRDQHGHLAGLCGAVVPLAGLLNHLAAPPG
eukprot:7033993-Prymnesium_polylepis.2